MAEGSQALSPEVSSLFETIKRQAHQYSEVMERLEIVARDIESKQHELVHHIDSVRSEGQELLLDIRKSAESTLRAVDSKSTRINKIYDTLDKMESSLEDSSLLNRQLDDKLAEVTQKGEEFEKWKTESVQAVSKSIHDTFGTQLAAYKQEVSSLRQQVKSITDLASRNLHTLQEEMAEFKSKFPNPDIMAQEARYEVKLLRAEMNEHFNKVLSAFKDEAQHILDHAWEQEEEMSTRVWDEETIDKEIRSLREISGEARKTSKAVKTDLAKLKGLQTAALITAMVSAAIAVVALSF